MKHVKVIHTDRLYTDIDGKRIPVDKTQINAFKNKLTEIIGLVEGRYISHEGLEKVLTRGIDIDPSLIEVRAKHIYENKPMHWPIYKGEQQFSFLKQQAKEETNEAIQFAEWMRDNATPGFTDRSYWVFKGENFYSTKELYEIFKRK
jgi:hypothetical protein